MDWLKPWSGLLGGVVIGNFFVWWLLFGKSFINALAIAITSGTLFVLLIGCYELIKRCSK